MGRVVFVSCTPVGRAMISEVLNNPNLEGIEIVGIVNLDPLTAVNKCNYDPYIDLSIKTQIPMIYCASVNSLRSLDFIREKEPDIVIQAGWSERFKSSVLDIPKYGCIGQHPSPLPVGRGAASINWAMIKGIPTWGNSLFEMKYEYDAGLIYAQENLYIDFYDTIKTVFDKIAYSSVIMLRKNLVDWCQGNFNGIKQDDSKATYFTRRRPEDGLFSFDSLSALDVYNKIRALTRPYPGAFFEGMVDGLYKNVYVWDAEYGGSCLDKVSIGGGIYIRCSDGDFVLLKRVQVEDQPEQWAFDFIIKHDVRIRGDGRDYPIRT